MQVQWAPSPRMRTSRIVRPRARRSGIRKATPCVARASHRSIPGRSPVSFCSRPSSRQLGSLRANEICPLGRAAARPNFFPAANAIASAASGTRCSRYHVGFDFHARAGRRAPGYTSPRSAVAPLSTTQLFGGRILRQGMLESRVKKGSRRCCGMKHLRPQGQSGRLSTKKRAGAS